MAPNPRRQDERLAELYDQVPTIRCKGSCHDACCFIDASVRERDVVERASGERLETHDALAPGGAGPQFDRDGRPLARFRCSMLTNDGRCSVYEDRPMVCRLFGTVKTNMECHHGCRPERMLSSLDAIRLLLDSFEAGGYPTDWGSSPGYMMRKFLETLDDAGAEELLSSINNIMTTRMRRSSQSLPR